jgi:hypothetical protein
MGEQIVAYPMALSAIIGHYSVASDSAHGDGEGPRHLARGPLGQGRALTQSAAERAWTVRVIEVGVLISPKSGGDDLTRVTC